MRHCAGISAAVACLLVASRAPGATVSLMPRSPDEQTDLRAVCTLDAEEGAAYRWAINGRTVSEGEFAASVLIHCDTVDELAAAGAESAAALTLAPGRGVRVSAASPLVLPAGRYFDPAEGSIEFWFRPEWNGDDGLGHPMFYAASAGGPTFFIEKEPAPYQGLVFYIQDRSGTLHGVWTSGTSLRAGDWHHLCCYWDLDVGQGAGCRMGMYLDGVLVDSSPSVGSAIPSGPPPERIVFGKRDAAGSADCVIDEIRFSKHAPQRPTPRISTEPGPRTHEAVLQAWRFAAGDNVSFVLTEAGREIARASVAVRGATGMLDQYGGWKKIKGARTGFFHCEEHGGKWWMVTPEGNAFFALGTDHARYEGHWCQALGYAPYGRFVQEKYGDESKWAEATIQRLKDWNFNLLSAGDSESLRNRGLAHTEFLSMGVTFAGTDDIVPKTTWTGFPNVFSPEWKKHCEGIAAAQCAPNAEDSWLLGYFIDNELEWYGKSYRESGIFEEAFKKPAEHTAKQALVRFLKERHGDVVGFNEVWGTHFRTWDELAASTQPPPTTDPRTEADWRGFLRLVADRYFGVARDAICKYDPNHMIIGSRFAGGSPGIWDICGTYCDVVTLNYYGRVDMEREEAIGVEENFTKWFHEAGKPLMITEWSFPALDSGLPCMHGAGMRVDTQAQKSDCFRIYQTTFFRLPFMVGSDYFMYLDEPAQGISETFPEDSNYGLVNEKDEPYRELTETATKLQRKVYEIHSGEAPELSAALSVRGQSAQVTVANRGRTPADAQVELSVDGKAERRGIEVPAGGERTLEFKPAALGDGLSHYVVATVDPEERTGDWDRRNNRADQVVLARAPERRGEALVAVANPSAMDLDVPVAVKLGELMPAEWLSEVKAAKVAARDAAGHAVPVQVDHLSAGEGLAADDEVALLMPVPAGSCRQVTVDFSGATPPIAPESLFAFTKSGRGYTLSNGALALDATQGDGRLADVVRMGGDVLGELTPLMWQEAEGRDWWATPNVTMATRAHIGPARAVVDVAARLTDVGAPQEPPATAAFQYRTTYRLILYPGRPWFTSRFLSIEDTDPRPWTLRGYFHFARSALGGDRAGDGPGVKVPNYYLSIGVWGDDAAGLYYGCLAPEAPGCSVQFWTDAPEHPETQHADARRQVDVSLKPGQVYASGEPDFVLFGGHADGTSAPWRGIVAELRALQDVKLSVRPCR